MADDFPVPLPDDPEDWSEEVAREEFFKRLNLANGSNSAGRDLQYRSDGRCIELKSPKGKGPIWPVRLSVPYAAATIVLATSMGWFGYRLGAGRTKNVPLIVAQTPAPDVSPMRDRDAAFLKERESLSARVEERDRTIARLSDKVVRQTSEVERLLQERQKLNDSLQKAQTERDQGDSEREALGRNLEESQAELAREKKDLEALETQRGDDALREAEVEARLAKFSDLLKDRDLMGARELYIAEVLDVGRNGETKKPVGRVFFTKGRSLIFYAYDLDQQPGLRNASTFQAWGRRGPDPGQSTNLGIFYMDSAAHKRWVMKSNDSKSLQQIDAVFVTVEPKGGSQKPTGKQLLFAYLRVEPNHP
jgi:hypothetical protein